MRELVDKVFYCQYCQAEFLATRTAKFCGPKCRTAAHRAKQKPDLIGTMVERRHFELIEQWNATRQLSDFAAKLIKELYERFGYEAARLAIVAANAQYENVYIKTEAHYQARETERAERIAAELKAGTRQTF